MKGFINTRCIEAFVKYNVYTRKDDNLHLERQCNSLPEMITVFNQLREEYHKDKSENKVYDSICIDVCNGLHRLERTYFDFNL